MARLKACPSESKSNAASTFFYGRSRKPDYLSKAHRGEGRSTETKHAETKAGVLKLGRIQRARRLNANPKLLDLRERGETCSGWSIVPDVA